MTKQDSLDDLLEDLEAGLRADGAPQTGEPVPNGTNSPTPRVRKVRRPVPEPPAPEPTPAPTPESPPPLEDHKVLWSERHPALFDFSRALLPRAPVLVVILPLLYAILLNVLRGDFFFFVRWYRDSWFLTSLVHVLSSKQAFMEWFSYWGFVTVLLVLTFAIAATVMYFTLWRFLFPDYIRQTEGVETYEGRAYWVEGRGAPYHFWDGLYAPFYRRKFKRPYKPQRTEFTAYVNTRRFINPFSPSTKMLKIHLSKGRGESLERRGPFELVVHEGLYRRITGIREVATHNEGYVSSPITLSDARSMFLHRSDELVKETQKLTRANVGVRLEKMKAGTVVLDDEIRQMIIDERNYRKEKAGT